MTIYTQAGDIKFYYSTNTMEDAGPAEVRITDADLHRDPGLETAVLISLFSDARAREQDALPQGHTNRSGWFGSMIVGVEIGSRLWLLCRSVIDGVTLSHIEQYCKDALQWMIDDGMASEVTAVASRASLNQINFSVKITRPKSDVNFKFFVNWQHQTFGGIE
jgi:phage gp46-like protein